MSEKLDDDLLEEELVRFAIKQYYTPLGNHLIIIFNVFGYYGGLKILETKLDDRHWPVIKPFLLFLNAIKANQYTEIDIDKEVEEKLRNI